MDDERSADFLGGVLAGMAVTLFVFAGERPAESLLWALDGLLGAVAALISLAVVTRATHQTREDGDGR